jgi:hypothetical protein
MPRLIARLGIAAFFVIVFGALSIAAANGSWSIETLLQLTAFASFAIVGTILIEQTGNRIGWICLVIGIGGALTGLGQEYTHYWLSHPGAPGVDAVAAIGVVIGFPATGMAFTFLPLLFPDGHLPSRRWLPVAVFAAVDLALLMLAFGLSPQAPFADRPNPIAVLEAGPFYETVVFVAGVATIATGLLCASALLFRYRGAGPVERQQLKWVAAAVAVFAVSLVISVLFPPIDTFAWVLPVIPISVGIAVLRYRLYDIDVIISRALVYIPLTGLLGGLYAASVALFQRLFVALTGDRSDAAVIITTLILAGVFTPARKSLEGAVDRRFKPGRSDPATVDERTEGPALDPALVSQVEAIARRVVDTRLAERNAALVAATGDGLASSPTAGYHRGRSIPVEEAEGVMDKKAKVPKKPKQGKAKGPAGK